VVSTIPFLRSVSGDLLDPSSSAQSIQSRSDRRVADTPMTPPALRIQRGKIAPIRLLRQSNPCQTLVKLRQENRESRVPRTDGLPPSLIPCFPPPVSVLSHIFRWIHADGSIQLNLHLHHHRVPFNQTPPRVGEWVSPKRSRRCPGISLVGLFYHT